MATTPFSSELVTKLKQATAWRFNSRLGPVFTPRFFCCDDPNSMGISAGKEPVAVLDMDPNPCLVGDTVSFDGTDSYDPDGSITAYAFTFPSGTPISSSSSSGTVSWAAAGEYEVRLVVTDGTSKKSTPARVIQQVLEPQNSYYIGTSNGVWYTADGGTTWTAKNTGLSGDALKVNDLVIDPATANLADSDKVIWIGTDAGLYVSNDGGDNWTIKNPAAVGNDWSDSPAPTVAGLKFVSLMFAGDRLYAIANWQNGASEWRSWLYYTDDAGNVRDSTGGSVSWTEV